MGLSRDFWRGRRVLITGHTGFKGAWLALWLERLGAVVAGVALAPESEPSLFASLEPAPCDSRVGDLRDPAVSDAALAEARPDVVFHLAAQALVRRAQRDPVATFASNVLGTAHLLEAAGRTPSVGVVLVATSDKVYAPERGGPYREGDALGGREPYSASKACQELVAASYRERLAARGGPRIATARAGNVIGGGDWADERLIPDVVRAAAAGVPVEIRHPEATRPWQHVLDVLAGYLAFAEALHGEAEPPTALNFGPAASETRSVGWLVEQARTAWPGHPGWKPAAADGLWEERDLSLDASRAAARLDWRPRLSVEQALDWTLAWYRDHGDGADARERALEDVERYEELRS